MLLTLLAAIAPAAEPPAEPPAEPGVVPPTLPAIYADGMVLQRDTPITVRGLAEPLADVTVTLANHTAAVTAGPHGRFAAELPATPAGGPHTLTVTAGGGSVAFDDVLVGEVWVASGQSNMSWPVNALDSADTQALTASAGDDGLRLFTVPRLTAPTPRDLGDGAWARDDAEAAAGFSAVAYYFGRRLREELDVPVGLVHSSWGGTPAEAWTPRGAMWADPVTRPIVARDRSRDPDATAAYQRMLDQFEADRAAGRLIEFHDEPENTGLAKGYADPGFDDAGWTEVTLPNPFTALGLHDGPYNGVVWFRKTVDLPPAMRGVPLTLSLGPIDDMDDTYVNATHVGGIDKDTHPNDFYIAPRVYDVPPTDAATLTVAVRVFDHFGEGGLLAGPMTLTHGDQTLDHTIDLTGEWRAHLEHELDASIARGPGMSPPAPAGVATPHHQPAALYNAMIAPLVGYDVRGVIWYQGESNAGRPTEYATLFPLMIESWRTAWGEPDLPFYFVQLAGFREPTTAATPTDPYWAHLREAQRRTTDKLPATGMAVAIDIGEADDIHPRNKRDVGHRLARLALADVYGLDVTRSGPTFEAVEFTGGEATVRFGSTGQGLRFVGEAETRGFTVAGADGEFVPAEARIDGDTVVVSSPDVPEPAAVRYAWADNPVDAALVCEAADGTLLPATPFRTNAFPPPPEQGR